MKLTKTRTRKGARKKLAWIKQAWFAPTVAYPFLTDLLVAGEEVRDLGALFSRDMYYERDQEALRQIYRQIVAGHREYLWAFGSLADAVTFIRLRRSVWFRPFPDPNTIGEYAMNALYQRFPFDANVTIDWLVFHGEASWHDPRSGSHQAGSMAGEVPHLIARRDWRDFARFGFEDGLSLVAVEQDQPFYRADEALIEQVWANVKRQKAFHDERVSWDLELRRTIEREARRRLIQFLVALSPEARSGS